MTVILRQSTASQEVLLPRMVSSTDGNTPSTGLTIANTDIKIFKAGATTQASKNSGGATHISNGDYYCVLDATDTNTVGQLVITCHPSGALYTRIECDVLPANVFDARYGTASLLVSIADVMADPSVAPAMTDSVIAGLSWLVALHRNKVKATASTMTLRNAADSGNVATAALSDDNTTFTRAGWS